jgi:4-amino-4-deoxy-L-arabinose transferase-like glycosyltransferase
VPNIENKSVTALLTENYPLIAILIGAALVSVSLGPFHNVDTQLEFDAASGVIRWGLPHTIYGDLINQPPIGFYTEALFLKIFGATYSTGVAMITLIGLGCTMLLYQTGKTLYGKPTATLAAALFALTPWHLALSRSFLIDTQCLFLSLLCLLVGVYAIRKDSLKLFLISGTLFAAALLTKFFAVFILIPLALFYFRHRRLNLSRTRVVAAYFAPALLLIILWYQLISGLNLLAVVGIEDFRHFNPTEAAPSVFFLINYLLDGLGVLFLIAAALSLTVTFADRRLFAKFLPFDIMCLTTILVVGGINTFLVAGLNFSAPYINPIKYDYQFLPFFSLLAASLAGKCVLLYNSMKAKKKLIKLLFSVALVGMALLAASMLLNMNWVTQYSTWDHWLFKVDRTQNVGYALINSTPIGENSFLISVQHLGFAFTLSGLLWAIRHELASFLRSAFKRMRLWIEAKNALIHARPA